MSINPIEENSTPKTTGSLEELFRHHLGEEAAVPPRPMLWDQIDNSLLVRQNEMYRRRLAATRWVAAASLLLATLAGTGWWARRDTNLGGAGVAVVTDLRAVTGSAAGTGSNSRVRSAGATATSSQADIDQAVATAAGSSERARASAGYGAQKSAVAQVFRSVTKASGAGATLSDDYAETVAYSATPARTGAATLQVPAATQPATAGNSSATDTTAPNSSTGTITTEQLAVNQANAAGLTGGNAQAAQGSVAAAPVAAVLSGSAVAGTGGAAGLRGVGVTEVASLAPNSASAVLPSETVLLGTMPVELVLNETAALPGGLAANPVPEVPPAAARSKWSYGAAYSSGLFNPNINFSRAGIESEHAYNTGPAFGPESPALTEAAATEYRANLRPGLSQRIALLATRHLRGHWSLSTGAELNQSVAQSSSTSYFVGEQLFNPDLFQAQSKQPRTTNFRYRLASVPMEVRYDNPAKKGWSLYGRLGGVMSALLGVRSEVDGYPEATRTYSIASAGTPYRRVMGSVRGGTGARFGTESGKWALTLGPVAELGLLSLNAHPAQGFTGQSRPYSIGFEAGVEFGR